MLCDDCGRNEAVVHITQIGPDGKVEKNLCKHCAANYGEFLAHPQERRPVAMDDFLKGIFSNSNKENQESIRPGGQTELVCPNCGMSYRDFQQSGKIGCADCYQTFRPQLEPLLRRIHGSSVHRGKIPHRSGGTLELKHEIGLLRQQLQESIAHEEYEKAAEYRDKIRALEKELSMKEGGAEHVSD